MLGEQASVDGGVLPSWCQQSRESVGNSPRHASARLIRTWQRCVFQPPLERPMLVFRNKAIAWYRQPRSRTLAEQTQNRRNNPRTSENRASYTLVYIYPGLSGVIRARILPTTLHRNKDDHRL